MVVLNSDSQKAIQSIKCTRSANKSKYMNLHFHFVKDSLLDNIITLEYFQSEIIPDYFLQKLLMKTTWYIP